MKMAHLLVRVGQLSRPDLPSKQVLTLASLVPKREIFDGNLFA
jgi:hypothetical protein